MNQETTVRVWRTQRPARVSWYLFDFGNSAFPTVMITFVFAAYFSRALSVDEATGAANWGYLQSYAALIVAVTAPLVGLLADRYARGRLPMAATVAVTCLATAGLWWAEPMPTFATYASVLVIIGVVGFELGMLFYNALLVRVTDPQHQGRVSGAGWGVGYVGGLCCLALSLGLVELDLGFDKEAAEHVRATCLLVALWFALFSLPILLVRLPHAAAPVMGDGSFRFFLREARALLVSDPRVFGFLFARMLFIDGLNAIFALGGLYAANVFGMEFGDILIFGIGLNVGAGVGAFLFGYLEDRIHAKYALVVALAGLLIGGILTLLAQEIPQLWVAGLFMSLFIGPIQAISRSQMASLVDDSLQKTGFGLFAISGRLTAFLGPLLFAVGTEWSGSERVGMGLVLVLVVAGLLVLLPLDLRRRKST